MLLALLAFGIACFAVIRSSGLSARIKRIEDDRDDLRAKLSTLQKRLDWLRSRAEPSRNDVKTGDMAPGGSEPALPTGPASAEAPAAAPSAPFGDPLAGASGAKGDGTPSGPAAPPPPPLRPETPSAPAYRTAPPHSPKPPEPTAPPIDWESLLGVKGAAWVGGIALITSAILFARWTIEQGLLTPELRFLTMLGVGALALVAAEIGLRKGYERTANPLSGAGIAILYIAFFAGHARYGLISLPTAFAGMVMVTVAACVLAVRYDAFATAVLGLLGGFATPVALSTGEDRPIGLFSYILLLNLGLLAVGAKRRWPGLFELGLIGTLLIQAGWFSRFMSPGNLLVGLVSFGAFGVVYLLLPLIARLDDNARVLRTGALGGLMPFLFTVYLAGSPQYIEQWPLLFGMMGLLNLALLTVAVLRDRGGLLLSAAVATAVTLVVWSTQGLDPSRGVSALAVTAFAVGLTAIFGLARRFALRFGSLDEAGLRLVEAAALAAMTGLGLFGAILIGHERGSPAGPFLLLASALAFLLLERAGHEHRVKGALAIGAAGIASVVQLWFLTSVSDGALVPYLAVPVVCSLLFSFFAATSREGGKDVEAELAVRASTWISILGLFLTLAKSDVAASGWPLFMAIAAHIAMGVASVLRTEWTIGLPAFLGASSLHLLIWELGYMKPHQHGVAFAFGTLFYLAFVALPMVTPFAKWREAVLPWATSALAGPVFFLPLYYVYKEAFGDSAIGFLPLVMAFVSVVSLRVVSGRFVAEGNDALSARLRLRYLALFTAVAMWFIAVAIPLQLDRQWITLGWAIEAMALCWLFGRLPHRGLPLFAFVLYAFVGARLLLNPEILRYQERGLPFLNWILYTYGIATVCCLAGQSFLRNASENPLMRRIADLVALNGLLLGFWLVNLEILDYYSTGAYIAISGQSGYSVKLALSAGWGLYSLVLLVAGVAKDLKPLRYLSLAFILLTVAKVFLYDLSALGGIFRVLSFLGLAVGLILVSLFYQRFVFRKSQ